MYSGRDLTPADASKLTLGPTHFLTKARVQPQQLEALVLTMLRTSRQMEEALPRKRRRATYEAPGCNARLGRRETGFPLLPNDRPVIRVQSPAQFRLKSRRAGFGPAGKGIQLWRTAF